MRRFAVLSAAILFVPLTTFAQFRVGSDGQAADANTRLGSNGYNSNSAPAPYVTGNQVITGNVTGLGYFHGSPYTDPSAFRGQTGSSSFDPFLRQSTAAPLRGGPPTDANNFAPQAFYGGQTAAPPTGYSRDPYSGTYIQNRNLLTPGAADINYAVPPNISQLQVPQPGTNYLVGAPGAGNTQIIVAPLPSGGVTTWQPQAGTNQYYLSRTGNYIQDRPDRKPTDDRTILQMRSELQQTNMSAAIPNKPIGNSLSDLPQKTNAPGVNPTGNQPPLGANQGLDLTPQPIDASVANQQVSSNRSFATNQSVQNILPPPSQQSSQLAELERRLNEANGIKPLNTDVTPRPTNDTLPPAKPAAKDNTPAPFAPSLVAPSPVAPRPDAPNFAIPSGANLKPMKVESLATGFHATGLQSQMQSAEDAMREGKFTTAIARYETAEKVAPNNALVLLGRAHAELGGGYYERAEIDLRRAIAAEPALVLGQYNLKSTFGEQRLQFLINDLKQLAANDKKPARPVLLLAYIAYNSGNEDKAGAWLDEAENRGLKNDALISTFKKGWTLPAK